MGQSEALLLAAVIILAVVGLERLLLRRLLIPCSRLVSRVSEVVFTPFSWVLKPLGQGLKKVKERCFSRVAWIRNIDAADDAAALCAFGGLWKLLTMAFCLLFTVAVFLAEVLTAHTDAVGEELILSLPIFAVFEIFLEDPFAYEALLQLALFSVLSVSFMRRNEESTDGLVTVLYDLIFTGFCTCFLHIIPQVFYRLPVTAVTWCRTFTTACSDIPVINVLVWVVAIPLFAVIGYVIACTYLLALREALDALAYSLIPMTLFTVALVFLQELHISTTLMIILCFVLLLVFCLIVGVCRVRGQKRARENGNTRRRRCGLFRRRKKRKRKNGTFLHFLFYVLFIPSR